VREHLSVLIAGPTGIDKGYLGAAIAYAHAACSADLSVRCFRLPRLMEEPARYAAMQRRSALFRQLAKADLLVLDDFGAAPVVDATLDRLVHNSYRLVLRGESMRRRKTTGNKCISPPKTKIF
jgi:DNA replication protein DnaC